jgi:hypothetical protein
MCGNNLLGSGRLLGEPLCSIVGVLLGPGLLCRSLSLARSFRLLHRFIFPALAAECVEGCTWLKARVQLSSFCTALLGGLLDTNIAIFWTGNSGYNQVK